MKFRVPILKTESWSAMVDVGANNWEEAMGLVEDMIGDIDENDHSLWEPNGIVIEVDELECEAMYISVTEYLQRK